MTGRIAAYYADAFRKAGGRRAGDGRGGWMGPNFERSMGSPR